MDGRNFDMVGGPHIVSAVEAIQCMLLF